MGRAFSILVVGLGATIWLMLRAQFIPAFAAMVVLWLVFFWPTKLVVRRDDLQISWLGTRTILSYGEIQSAFVYRTGGVPFGVEILSLHGKRIRVPVFRPALGPQRQILRTVLSAIAKAQTAAGFPPIAPAASAPTEARNT